MKTIRIKTSVGAETVPVKTTAGKGRLNVRDFIKGLIIAVGTPVLYMIQELIPGWPLSPIEKAALSATVTYLLKNLFNPAQVVIKKSDLPD